MTANLTVYGEIDLSSGSPPSLNLSVLSSLTFVFVLHKFSPPSTALSSCLAARMWDSQKQSMLA